MLGIYELAVSVGAWDTRGMIDKAEKKEASQRFALQIADRLSAIQPPLLSEREWTVKAGVSPSFFSNLRGTPTKPPSVPSVNTLADVLRVAGVTLSEFFLPESGGKLARAPSEQALERALSAALVRLPKKPSDRAAYLLEAVRGVLALPAARQSNQGDDWMRQVGAHEEDALPLAATSQR